MQHFPFLLISRDKPTALDYKYDDSAPADGGVVCPMPRSNQIICLPLPYSRHVASTFKRLTTCTIHYGLSTFSLNRRGLNHKYHPMTPPVNLMIAVCGKP